MALSAVVSLTPHRYVLRTSLRKAATRFVQPPAPVLEVALDAGFGDISNFNHGFRNEFGMSLAHTEIFTDGDRSRCELRVGRCLRRGCQLILANSGFNAG